MSVETQTELQQLKQEITELKAAIFTLQKNQSSRMGTPGARGEKGDVGSSGRDAVVTLVQDGQTVRVLSNQGSAEILTIPIPGRDGVNGHSPSVQEILQHVPIPKDGKDGKDAPTLSEIVEAVLAEFSSRVKK